VQLHQHIAFRTAVLITGNAADAEEASQDAFVKAHGALGPHTRIERLRVNGGPGFWISGRPHSHAYVDARGVVREDTLRLAGDTLLWQRGAVTMRLEGAGSKAEALKIARSVR